MSQRATRLAAGLTLATALAVVPAVPAAAAAAVPCFEGYVCVVLGTGTIVAVPEGRAETFPADTTMTAITNWTKTSYCVRGTPNFGLAAGAEIVRKQTIVRFAPGSICLS
jgi:hypothetical protein